MFERRHYDWLARWAGDNVNHKAARSLATALATDNPNFQPDRFIVAYGRRRLSHLAEVEASKRAQSRPDRPPIDHDPRGPRLPREGMPSPPEQQQAEPPITQPRQWST